MKLTALTWLSGSGAKVGTATLAGLVAAALASGCSGKSSDDDDDSGGENSGAGRAGSAGAGGAAGLGGSAGASGSAGVGGSGGAAGSDCEPRPCTASVCGVMQDDGCGTLVECSCPDGCVPATCESEGAQCGTIEDGCGETLDCGECSSGCSCDDGVCLGDAESAEAPRRYGQKAESSGYHGTLDQYDELYVESCFSADDCVAPCLQRDGTQAMCEAMTCQEGAEGDHCLPPTIWLRLEALASEGIDTYADCAELVVWPDPYRDFLRVTDFKFEIPEAAEIQGITVTVRRAGGSSDEAVDDGVHLIKGGTMGSADRSSPTPWSGPDLVNVNYGDATDLWNESWTPADINAPDFGVALSASYTQSAGSGRAYVDIVYVTVHYRAVCE
jgi:hypothetical protein